MIKRRDCRRSRHCARRGRHSGSRTYHPATSFPARHLLLSYPSCCSTPSRLYTFACCLPSCLVPPSRPPSPVAACTPPGSSATRSCCPVVDRRLARSAAPCASSCRSARPAPRCASACARSAGAARQACAAAPRCARPARAPSLARRRSRMCSQRGWCACLPVLPHPTPASQASGQAALAPLGCRRDPSGRFWSFPCRATGNAFECRTLAEFCASCGTAPRPC